MTDAKRYARLGAALLSIGAFAVYALPWTWVWTTVRPAGQLQLYLLNKDFVNYWMGSILLRYGRQMDLFDQATYLPHLHAVAGAILEERNWSYPPHFLLLLTPLAYLDYRAALAVFLVATFVLFMVGALLFVRAYAPKADRVIVALAIAAFAIMMIDATQNGFLTGGLTLVALATMYSRPAVAGLCLALLTIKPQLGILLPLLLLADRNWRAIGWSVAFTVLFVMTSIAVVGTSSWEAYFAQTMVFQSDLMANGTGGFLRMMPTVYGSLRALGVDSTWCAAIQAIVSVPVSAVLLVTLLRDTEPLSRICAVLIATFLVTPYAFNYDMGAATVAVAVAAGSSAQRNQWTAVLLAVTAMLPGLVSNLGRGSLPITPILLLLTFLVLARRAWPSPNADAGPAIAR